MEVNWGKTDVLSLKSYVETTHRSYYVFILSERFKFLEDITQSKYLRGAFSAYYFTTTMKKVDEI